MAQARLVRSLAVLSAAVATLAGCAGTTALQQRLRDRLGDAVARSQGGRHLASSRQGNLGDAAVFSREERQVQLEDFILRHRAELGASRDAALQFVPAGAEADFQQGGRLLVAVPLSQAAGGFRILDRQQLGVFDLETGALTSAGVHLVEPASLKPFPLPKNREPVPALATAHLRRLGLRPEELTVAEDPAYSVAVGAAGFEVRCTARRPGLLLRIVLLVHPELDSVVVVSRQEVDQAR